MRAPWLPSTLLRLPLVLRYHWPFPLSARGHRSCRMKSVYRAVSYTHLDVYKRQVACLASGYEPRRGSPYRLELPHCEGFKWEAFACQRDISPVSYTHLDVYKRQAFRRAGSSLEPLTCKNDAWVSAPIILWAPCAAASAPDLSAGLGNPDVYKRQAWQGTWQYRCI